MVSLNGGGGCALPRGRTPDATEKISIHASHFFLGYLNARANGWDYRTLREDPMDPRLWPPPPELRALLQTNGLHLSAGSGIGFTPFDTIVGRLTCEEAAGLRRLVREWEAVEPSWRGSSPGGPQRIETLLGQAPQTLLERPEMAHLRLKKEVATTHADTEGRPSRFSVWERTYANSNRTVVMSTGERTSTVAAENRSERLTAVEVVCSAWSNDVLATRYTLPEAASATPAEVLGRWGRADLDHDYGNGRRVIDFDHRGDPDVNYRFEFWQDRLERVTVSRP